MYVIANDELYHHGVLGMKWGVRRYQSYDENPKASAKASYKAKKKQINEDYKAEKKDTRGILNIRKRMDAKAKKKTDKIIAKADYYKEIGDEKKEARTYRRGISGSGSAILPIHVFTNGRVYKNLNEHLEATKGYEYKKQIINRARKVEIAKIAAGAAANYTATKALQKYANVKLSDIANANANLDMQNLLFNLNR